MNYQGIEDAANQIKYFFSLWDKDRDKEIARQEKEWCNTVEAMKEESRRAREEAKKKFTEDWESRKRKDWMRRY